ncbi:cell division protein PerM [Virgisporangium ochraceum]|uniref:Integral membrane protein n=1 Tax=Virgisporangium ochraceum TaxID=65505 RepID=A0A8J3ZNI5_9ACTN|nr:DUF6350 family protein [Virgisporangium ochraceum]GIJ65280.1 hypothetical protein Voc01_001970 [Virgisporangium ochraceum]
MSATQDPPTETRRVPREQRRPRESVAAKSTGAPLVLAAAVTTAWAVLVSATPVLLAAGAVLLISPSPTDSEAVLRSGFAAWLLAHGVPLKTDLGPIGLTPLAISVLAAWRVSRAGVHAARAAAARRSRSVVPAVKAGAAVALAYGVYGTVLALAVSTAGLGVPALRAGLTMAVFGAVTGLAGALWEGGWHARWGPLVPAAVRDGVRTGAVAALLVIAAGAAATGLALALSAGVATDMVREYRTGVVGQAGLTLVCLVYAPNLAVWGASYLVGPGFALGAGTTVSAGAVSLGPVPALPVLAAVPSRPLSAWSGLLLAVPLVAGMIAGWLLARRQLRAANQPRSGAWGRLLVPALLAGPVAGAALGLAALASGGPVGSGRLTEMGAAAWPLAGIAAAVMGAGVVAAAAVTKGMATRRHGL